MLWEKAIRWYMLGLASFLGMTAFAVSYKTLAQIPKYPPGSFFQFVISQRLLVQFEFSNLNVIVGAKNRITWCVSVKVWATHSFPESCSGWGGVFFSQVERCPHKHTRGPLMPTRTWEQNQTSTSSNLLCIVIPLRQSHPHRVQPRWRFTNLKCHSWTPGLALAVREWQTFYK